MGAVVAARLRGFRPLRPVMIHLLCLKCGRKMSNGSRGKFDPPNAVLVESFCPKCGQGSKDPCEYFYDSDGREIPWSDW